MGIGFVLFVGAACALLAAVILSAVGWQVQKRASARLQRRIIAALVPLILLLYGGIGFIAYATWCEMVRHVDLGIGDSAHVPIDGGYFLCVVDVTSFLVEGDCDAAPLVDQITELTRADNRVIGLTESRGAFVLDTRSHALRTYPDLTVALKEFSQQPTLQPVETFYASRRWGYPDLIALGLIGIPGAAVFALWGRSCLCSLRSSAQSASTS